MAHNTSSAAHLYYLASRQRAHADQLERFAIAQGALSDELAGTIAYVRAEADRCESLGDLLQSQAA